MLLWAVPLGAQELVVEPAGQPAALADPVAGHVAPLAGPAVHPRLAERIVYALLRDPPPDTAHPAGIVELSIPSHGARLPGHMYLASGAGPHPTLVLLHGFPGNEKNLDLAQALRRFGFNVLFFHYRGAWGAQGSYRLSQLPEDALAVLDWLREPQRARELRIDTSALGVLGHSLGGYTALAAAARDDELRCAIALSPANPGLWKAGLAQQGSDTRERLLPYADSLYMLRGFSGAALIEDLEGLAPEALDTTLMAPGIGDTALLLVVGAEDDVTPAESMFEPVVAAYRAHGGIDLQARIISGDHSFSWSRMTLARTVLAWADDHCRAPTATAEDNDG
jgi:pimeloyl-ACP methyl ester carboxylesterase